MKTTKAFLKQISKNGLYIILFLCISAIGISGYVMYRTQEVEIPVTDYLNEIEEPVFDEYVPIEIPRIEPVIDEDDEPTPVVKETQDVIEEEPLEFVTAVKGTVQLPFTGDELIKSKTFDDWRTHAGIDIAAEEGSEVYAIASGVVEKVYEDDMMGYTVVISHREEIVSTYSNLMKGITVKVGQKVKAGDVIGGVGKSAQAECMEPEHLHLETTKKGEQIDPMSLIE